MYARLDAELSDHPKISLAAELIGGPDARAIAIGMYAVGLMYANKHLTDGHLSISVVKQFTHVRRPLHVADALTKAGLWEKNGKDEFLIHDFDEFNPSAKDIKHKRKEDRRRKAEARAADRH